MTTQHNWYKTFFNGMALEMWDNALPSSFTETEIRFIKEAACIPNDSKVLDVPCGSGRLSLPLAKEGFRMTSIDISEGNIQTLNKSKQQLDIQVVCADILEYQLTGDFDLAICMGNSFHYFTYEKMLGFVSKIRQSLKPGAKFIINSGATAESILPNLKDHMEMKVGEILFKLTNHYEAAESVLKTDMEFTKNGVTEAGVSYHFVYTLAEIKRLLTTAGFVNSEVYSSVDRDEYVLGSQQAYIIAD